MVHNDKPLPRLDPVPLGYQLRNRDLILGSNRGFQFKRVLNGQIISI
jgi:hypothetical protein